MSVLGGGDVGLGHALSRAFKLVFKWVCRYRFEMGVHELEDKLHFSLSLWYI